MGARAKLTFFIYLHLAVFSALADRGYDELYDGQKVRPEYQYVYEQYEKLNDQWRTRFVEESFRAFGEDNALHPLPRIIKANEYDSILRAGVEQRGKALLHFLRDHYSGEKRYLKSRVIPGDVVARVLLRAQEFGYDGRLQSQHISFFYGPDIVRDEKGQWRVIEDNTGYVGGLGDLSLAHQFTLEKYPDLMKRVRIRNPDQFYEKLIERYKRQAAQAGGVAVLYMVPPYPDREDHRIKKIFEEQGVMTVTPYTRHQLVVEGESAFLVDPQDGDRQKVGFVVLNGEHWWLDPSHLSYEERVVREAQGHLANPLPEKLRVQMQEELDKALSLQSQSDPENFKRLLGLIARSPYRNDMSSDLYLARQAKGLVELILSGRLKTNYSPGVDFVGDKEFYVFVENLIRFYLGEEPILKNIPTERFVDSRGRKSEAVFKAVFSDIQSYVVKKTDGRGGDGVWVGPKISSQEAADLEARVRQSPEAYIAQKYIPLSHLDGHIVDLRIFADVSTDRRIYVSPVPWGRGLPKNGNGKVNLSASGREFTVLIDESNEKDGRHMCREWLTDAKPKDRTGARQKKG